jgi:hypothetical protein
MATPRTGNKPGRPRKHAPIIRGDKPGPVPVQFMEDDDRYEVAKFNACLVSGKNSGRHYAMLRYGKRINDADVPPLLRKCADGHVNIFFPEPSVTLEGTPRNVTRAKPNSVNKWPEYVEGGEQTLRRKIKRVKEGDDQAAKDWLAKMTLAWLYPLLVAQRFKIGDARMWREALKSGARSMAMAANDGEENYANAVILPAIDIAIPIE